MHFRRPRQRINYIPKEEDFISEDRNVMLISEVDSIVPVQLKEQIHLIDEIIETDEKTLPSVIKIIDECNEPIDFIRSVIKYALIIRPLNTPHLSLLSQKYKCEYIFSKDDKMTIFKEDNLDLFVEISANARFTPKARVRPIQGSPVAFVRKEEDSFWTTSSAFSYLQIMAFYGAVKCFKHACLTNEYDFRGVEEFAVAGGNMEIIHILEQMNFSFEKCLKVSIKFHRNELSDWILIHFRCFKTSLLNSSSYYNYRATVFGLLNGVGVNNALSQSISCGHPEILKYLYETCHGEVPYDAMKNALQRGHLEIIKYLYETCHEKLPYNAIIDATTYGHLDIIKYFYETCHAEIPDDAIIVASRKGHLEVVKYLYETCHAEVDEPALNNAALFGHNIEVVKYLYDTCHIKITNYLIYTKIMELNTETNYNFEFTGSSNGTIFDLLSSHGL